MMPAEAIANAPILEERNGIIVVRDDKVPGGTKARVLPAIMTGPEREYVYASPVSGYAQVALATVARAMGKRATIFCAKRANRHRLTNWAAALGAHIVEVPVGYMTVVRSRARQYCAVSGGRLLPFGLDTPEFIAALADIARALPVDPPEVWTVAGSGVLTRGLQLAWPKAQFHAIRIGAQPNAGRAAVLQAPEKFEQDAKATAAVSILRELRRKGVALRARACETGGAVLERSSMRERETRPARLGRT